MQGTSAGVFIGSAILSWYPDPYRYDAKGRVFSKALGLSYTLRNLRGPVLWSSLICSTFTGVECLMESLRGHDSETWVNSAVAGAVSGVVMGAISKKFDVMAATAFGLGGLMGMVEFNGQTTVSAKSSVVPESKDGELSIVEGLKTKYPEYKHL
jgi:hypothetical protein